MKTFRYQTNHKWYKGNTHIHSTLSDGALDFQQLSELYAGQGYHFLFRTDHWATSRVRLDFTPYPLLWLDGIELDGDDETGAYLHVVCLGTFLGIDQSLPLSQALKLARNQGGILVLAHPQWTGNTTDDALRHPFHGVEVYNHVCQWLNGKGNGSAYWNIMLPHKPNTLCFAVDDAHNTPADPVWNGGWIMVNAPSLTDATILKAIRDGNFYSTTGPEFFTIECIENRLYVKTSRVQFIRMVGPGPLGEKRHAPDRHGITEAEFQVHETWPFVYLQLEDANHQLAWTNPLFISD